MPENKGPLGHPMTSVEKALQDLDRFAADLVCSLCNKIFKTPFAFKECGHTFCRYRHSPLPSNPDLKHFFSECIMAKLRQKCVCPTCKVPVQVKGLHKNLTFSTLVACSSQLKDLLESRQSGQSEDAQATQLSIMHMPQSHDILKVLSSVSDSDDEAKPQLLTIKTDPIEQLEGIVEPKAKRLAKRSAKVTPVAQTKTGTRMKTPTSAPVKEAAEKAMPVKEKATSCTTTPVAKEKPTKVKPVEKAASCNTTPLKEPLRILMSGLSPDDKALIVDYCREVQKGFKVSTVAEYDPKSVNRIIMAVDDNGLCTRTTKYLRGILDGKVIVTFTWFLDSLAQHQWLPSDSYLVKGDTSVGKVTNAPMHSLNRDQGTKLFDEYTFHLAGKFGTPSKQDLSLLLKAGGAKVLSTKPRSADKMEDRHMIIYDPDMLDDASLWITEFEQRTSGLWILDCISSYQILSKY